MKKVFVLALLIFVGVPSVAVSQEWEMGLLYQRVGTHETSVEGIPLTNFQFRAWRYVSERVGIWGFAYGEEHYISTTAGLYYDFTSWFELALAVGIEEFTDEKDIYSRFAGSLLLFGESMCPTELYYENGASEEYWYLADLLCTPIDGLGFGIYSQRYAGMGPRVMIRLLSDLPLEIWAAPAVYDFESRDWNFILGAQIVLRGGS